MVGRNRAEVERRRLVAVLDDVLSWLRWLRLSSCDRLNLSLLKCSAGDCSASNWSSCTVNTGRISTRHCGITHSTSVEEIIFLGLGLLGKWLVQSLRRLRPWLGHRIRLHERCGGVKIGRTISLLAIKTFFKGRPFLGLWLMRRLYWLTPASRRLHTRGWEAWGCPHTRSWNARRRLHTRLRHAKRLYTSWIHHRWLHDGRLPRHRLTHHRLHAMSKLLCTRARLLHTKARLLHNTTGLHSRARLLHTKTGLHARWLQDTANWAGLRLPLANTQRLRRSGCCDVVGLSKLGLKVTTVNHH